MEQKMKFAENVMLIDAAYINKVGNDIKEHFAPILNRELPKADLAVLLECMAMDAGIKGENNEIQVIFIYESNTKGMTFCTPSDFTKELHDMAFKSQLGEFSLYSFQTSAMTAREELFKESLLLLCESKDVKKMVLVPDEATMSDKVCQLIKKEKHSIATVMGMNPPATDCGVAFEMMGFALLQALGIKADEL